VPPSRRRPTPNTGQVPPVRRPRVAGLRHRQTDRQVKPTPAETPDETPADTSTETPTETPAAAETAAEPAVDSPETVSEHPAEPTAEKTAEKTVGETPAPPKVDLGADDPLEPDADRPVDADAELDSIQPPPPRTPRPAGKRRSTGTTRPADLTAAEAETKKDPEAARRLPAAPRRVANPYSVAAVLAVVAVILAGLAFWFRGEASALESRDPNTALTDSATTSEVLGQLTTAIETTLSYNYTDLDSTKKAVEDSLAESARCEYDQLFGQLIELAPKQKLILATTVRDIALVRLDGDRAEALVFIDLVSTRVDNNNSVPGDAVFGVRARRDGASWKITEFDMFDQPLPTGKPTPQC
jgi:Mce-associated membrane protein